MAGNRRRGGPRGRRDRLRDAPAAAGRRVDARLLVEPRLPGDAALLRRLRRRADHDPRLRLAAEASAEQRHRAARGPGGVPLGPRADRGAADRGRGARALRPPRGGPRREGRVRPRDVPRRGGASDRRRTVAALARGRAPSRRRRSHRLPRRDRTRPQRRRSAQPRQERRQRGARELQGRTGIARAAVRHHLGAEHRQPRIRLGRRLRPHKAGRHAEGALRLPLPEPQRGADLGSPALRPDRSRAPPRDHGDPRSRADAESGTCSTASPTR